MRFRIAADITHLIILHACLKNFTAYLPDNSDAEIFICKFKKIGALVCLNVLLTTDLLYAIINLYKFKNLTVLLPVVYIIPPAHKQLSVCSKNKKEKGMVLSYG